MLSGSHFNHQIEIKEGFIQAKLSGHAYQRDINNVYREIIAQAKQHKFNRLLMNLNELTLGYQSNDIFQFMKNFQSEFSQLRIARVVANDGLKQMLIQQYAEQTGLSIKNFDSEQAAQNWLVK